MRALPMLAMFAALSACAQPAAQNNDSAQQAPDTASAERELEDANVAYDQALIAGDAEALDRFYSDDFHIIDDDGNVSTKAEQIRFMTREVDLLEARSDDVQTRMLGPDSALVSGRFTGRYRYRNEEKRFVERYTSIWVREDGQWKLIHEHSSILPEGDQQQAREERQQQQSS